MLHGLCPSLYIILKQLILSNEEKILSEIINKYNIFFTDNSEHVVRKISNLGIVSTIIGNGSPGFSGDNGTANSAQISSPLGIAIDPLNNIYIADFGNINKYIANFDNINKYIANFVNINK